MTIRRQIMSAFYYNPFSVSLIHLPDHFLKIIYLFALHFPKISLFFKLSTRFHMFRHVYKRV